MKNFSTSSKLLFIWELFDKVYMKPYGLFHFYME